MKINTEYIRGNNTSKFYGKIGTYIVGGTAFWFTSSEGNLEGNCVISMTQLLYFLLRNFHD
jgi:hypothetical protein